MTYPKSFLKLLLIGFALVLLPLLLAFVNANSTFGKLTRQSLSNMTQAVETTRANKVLIEELAIMERSARQYFVLRDNDILNNYNKSHGRFSEAISNAFKQSINQQQQAELQRLAQQENALFNGISHANQQMFFDAGVADAFSVLSQQAYNISNINNRLIVQQADLLQQKITQSQQQLFWQTFTLIPLAIVIAGFITWLISKPIRQMDNAINQLGRGDYAHAITINGPNDLKKVGARLDWLRLQLKDLHQQKQAFLQQASHALKTPLTSIREASELLNDGTAGKLNAQQAEITAILRESSLRLQSMIENLLMFTQSQFNVANQTKIAATSTIHVQDVIQTILNNYVLSLTQKNITVIPAKQTISIQVDAECLNVLLDNFISNAIKFSLHNGSICFNLKQTSTTTTIEIIDKGIGIKEDNKQHVFEAFYRGEQPKNSKIEGSGLGLFIAKEAAIAMQADITLLPTEQGTHIVINIPNDVRIARLTK